MTRSDYYELARAPLFACAALANALLACSPQVDGEYRGEPLATIHGTVTSMRGALATDRPVVAAVLWYLQPSPDDIESKFVSDRVSVRGSFPANFTLDIYNPPPKVAEMTMTDEFNESGVSLPAGTPLGVWTGFVVAIDPRAKDDEIEKEDILGIDASHTLIYLAGPAAPWDRVSPLDAETVLQHQRYSTVSMYDIQPTQGFHLAKHNPTRQLGSSKLQECRWAGLCVHWSDPKQQHYFDWDFQRCTEHFPQNPTCSAQWEPAADEPAASRDCRGEVEARWPTVKACSDDAWAWLSEQRAPMYLENPAGLADPITIEMGTTLWDRSL